MTGTAPQVGNLIKIARPATAQSVLMMIFITIFSIMGKDLLGGALIESVPPQSQLAPNARVYVRAHDLAGIDNTCELL